MITANKLRKVLDYDPETGVFRWKAPPPGRHAGSIAGRIGNHGYWRVTVNGEENLAHRLAWLYMYGVWPRTQIDHINQDRLDNRINNLREATEITNSRNRKLPDTHKYGAFGIYRANGNGRWAARIRVNYDYIFLGCFDTKEEAISARHEAEKQYGFAPRHGKCNAKVTR